MFNRCNFIINKENMFKFDCKLLKTDITAIKYYKNHIFIGIGNFLFVYNRNDLNNCRLKLKIFEKRKIHGIIINELNNNETTLLIYGENALKLFELNFESLVNLTELKQIFIKDWILTCRFIKDHIVMIDMNNNLVVFDNNLKENQTISCKEKCILYSAFIINYNNNNELDNIIALSGTVFNEIIVWLPFHNNKILTKLQSHNGVIFSLDYNDNNQYLCSTSDDRSAILWKFNNFQIVEKCRVYGHESRVFRCKILQNSFVTCGEDSKINLWNFNGELLRRIYPHSGGTIWSIDYDKENSLIISGCSDGSCVLFPIYYNLIDKKLVIIDENPKHIGLIYNNNIVVITENGGLYYYCNDNDNNPSNKWLKLNQYDDLKKYVIFQISNCKKLLALAGYNGQIYFYKYSNHHLHYQYCYQTNYGRIFSYHWLDCNKFAICINSKLLSFVKIDNKKQCLLINSNNLPTNKCITNTAYQLDDKTLIVGDRNGNIMIFSNDNNQPKFVLKKSHNHLGITKILKCDHNEIVTIGRDSMIKNYKFSNDNNCKLENIYSDKLPLSWLCNYYNNEQLIVGFTSNKFVLFDYKNKQNLLEINCGGGHRSWDFTIINHQNQLNFIYVKNKTINLLQSNLNNLKINTIIDNYHINIINVVVLIKLRKSWLLISGGEDTCLYLHLYYKNQLYCLYQFKTHLSNIKTICKYELTTINGDNLREFLVFSGGGRGQIICWKLQFSKDSANLSCTIHDSYHDDNNDIRIMDLFIIKLNDCLLLFSGCSDGYINIFKILYNSNDHKYKIQLFKQLFDQLKCLLKISIIRIGDILLLLTCSTDGSINFWNISQILHDNIDIKPFRSFKLHQSGINCLDCNVVNDCLILATGGDDNQFVINYFQLINNDCIDLIEIDRFINCNNHCAQITGIYLYGDYCLTTSIDQKLIINHLFINNHNTIVCNLVNCYYSSISDIQGFQCFVDFYQKQDGFNVFLYGKGLEFVKSVKI